MSNRILAVCLFVWGIGRIASAQGGLAGLTGHVSDANAAFIIEANVTAGSVDTGINTVVRSNEEGIYRFVNLGPGNYEFSVSKRGFKVIVKPDVTLHVADTVSMNLTRQVGAVSETVRVEGCAPPVNTEATTVSTQVDRQFAEGLPTNGRSFQTAIQLTPGVMVGFLPAIVVFPLTTSTTPSSTNASSRLTNNLVATFGAIAIIMMAIAGLTGKTIGKTKAPWRAFVDQLERRLIGVLTVLSILLFDGVVLVFGGLIHLFVGLLPVSSNPFLEAARQGSAGIFLTLYLAWVLVDFWDYLRNR